MKEIKTTQVCTEIHEWIDEELGRKEVGSANRCSSAPQCVRKRWFQNQGMPGEKMKPRSIMVFALGDAVEHIAKYFISKACVGPGKLYSEVDFGEKEGTFTIQHREFDIYKQETLEFFVNKVSVTGHADGWGRRNEDGKWELIEIKSAADIGFNKFVKGENEYLKQAHAIMLSHKSMVLNVESVRFFYMNKNNSDIFDRLYPLDNDLLMKVIDEFTITNQLETPEIPEDLYPKQTGNNYTLHWKCSYCEYKKKCWPNAKLEFKSGRPVYYIKAE